MNHRAFAIAALWLVLVPLARGQAMFPLPNGALESRHVALQLGVYEQDSFVLEEAYPSTSALAHYERVFAKWVSCPARPSQWESFGDVSGVQPRFHHQLMRHWVNPGNNTAVTVALRYTSTGSHVRAAPDSTRQSVTVLRLNTKNAKSSLAQIGAACD